MALPERPVPMNAITNHSKVKLSITVPDPTFVGGKHVSGKMEMECRADKGLGIGVIMIELFGIQELSSRDHSATSTFLHAQRLFQGPGLPPSNAVQAHAEPGDPPLPSHHYHARRGISTFLFKISLPPTCPSSVSFGGGLATVKYELRASVSASWRGDKRVVTERKLVDVVDALDDQRLAEYAAGNNDATSIAVGENGKLWIQGKIVGGGIITAGESACVELQVKNHSTKKNTGLSLSLMRQLVLPNISSTEKQPVQVTDTLTSVPFRGPEYIIQPGVEGVANLVFDIPNDARGVKGGPYLDEGDIRPRLTPSIFEVQCTVTIKMTMGVGNKDLVLSVPVTIVNPLALPEELVFLPQERSPYMTPMEAVPGPYSIPATFLDPHPYAAHPPPISSPPPLAMSPQPLPIFSPYANPNQVWLPPLSQPPFHYQYTTFLDPLSFHEQPPQTILPPRPASALASSYTEPTISGLPLMVAQHPLLPLNLAAHHESSLHQPDIIDREEGKGERASRVSHHLHILSRNRSVSPPSHRYPLPRSSPGRPTVPTEIDVPVYPRTLPHPPRMSPLLPSALEVLPTSPPLHSPRPLLSPKLSQASLRSERVEELERLAAQAHEVGAERASRKRRKKASRKGKEKQVVADINKTLPTPPVPTRNGFLLPPMDAASDRINGPELGDDEITSQVFLDPAPPERAPPTPTLTAVTPVRHARSNLTEKLAVVKAESGLDALEQRLLAEVGTQKVERLFSAPRAQDIFGESSNAGMAMDNTTSMSGRETRNPPAKARLSPIKIPAPRDAGDDGPNIDSAISSLTLADGGWALGMDRRTREERVEPEQRRRSLIEEGHDHDIDGDSDERTHRAWTVGRKSKSKSSLSDDDGPEGQSQKRRHKRHAADGLLGDSGPGDGTHSRGRSRDGPAKEKKSGKKKEGHKRHKSTKGRVTAWLGTIEPGALPPGDDPLDTPLLEAAIVAQPSSGSLEASRSSKTDQNKQDTKTSTESRVRFPGDGPTAAPNPRSSGFIPIGTQKRETKRIHVNIPVTTNTHQSSVNQTAATPPTTPGRLPNPSVKPGRQQAPALLQSPGGSSGSGADKLAPSKTPHPNIQLPLSPRTRSQDPEIKYDVKSARGGRGGHVTAIAALWASGATCEAPKGRLTNLSKRPVADATSRKESRLKDTNPLNIQRVSKPIAPLAKPQTALHMKRSTPDISKGPPSVAVSEASPKLLGFTGKSNPVTKSPSVPAVISSSLATPMLSSTASLARSPIQQPKRPTVAAISNKPPPRPETSDRAFGPPKAKSTPDLAFGKARLRDLIKKYQEQAS